MRWKLPAHLLLLLSAIPAHAFQASGFQTGCTPPQPKLSVNRPNIFSEQQEQWLGDLQAEMVEPRYTLLPTAESAYLDALGQRILEQLPPTSIHYTFRVYESPYLKAFSLAGGHVYVSRKLIMDVQNEDELAAILAQEIGRVYIHHTASAITRLIESTLHVKHLGDEANVDDTFERMLNMPTDRFYSYLSFDEQRDDEVMADAVGLYAMIRAHFNPQAFPTVLDRINDNGGYTGNVLTDVFELTPIISIRVRMAKKAVADLPAGCVATADSKPKDFEKFQQAIENERIDPFVAPTPGLLSLALEPMEPALSGLVLSPDAKYVLAQDEYQIHVLSAQPVKLLFSINAYHAEKAQFTPDSGSVVFHYNDMHVEKWSIATEQPTSVQDFIDYAGCLQTSLSPDGNAMACVSPYYGLTGNTVWLKLADIANGKMLYENRDFYNDFQGTNINATMRWTRDGRYFLATSGLAAMAYDSTTKHTVKLDGDLGNLWQQRSAFVGSDRILFTCDWAVRTGSWQQQINMCYTTFPGGQKLKQFPLPFGTLRTVADSSHVLFGPLENAAVAVIDPSTEKVQNEFPENSVDVNGKTIAYELPSGGIGVGEMGGKIFGAPLPFTPLTAITTSAFSPNGNYLAISNRARGSVWDLRTGKRIAATMPFLTAWVDDTGKPHTIPLPYEGTRSFNPAQFPMQSGSVRLQFTANNVMQSYTGYDQLTVSDAATHAKLWSRNFIQGVPQVVPADDDQTLLATWYNRWSGGGKLTYTSDQPLITHINTEGTVVEVVDNRTGKVKHQLLIPEFFPADCLCQYHPADLYGSMLAVHSVHNETTVYRVDTGKRMFAFFGYALAGDESLGMLAATDRIQELNLYDTASGRRLAHLMLDQILVSARFLPEQKVLLVTTASQTVYRIGLGPMMAARAGGAS